MISLIPTQLVRLSPVCILAGLLLLIQLAPAKPVNSTNALIADTNAALAPTLECTCAADPLARLCRDTDCNECLPLAKNTYVDYTKQHGGPCFDIPNRSDEVYHSVYFYADGQYFENGLCGTPANGFGGHCYRFDPPRKLTGLTFK